MYSPQLLDHFQHPRNAGDLSDADSVAELENPACGDVVRLSLKMRDGRIEQVRFKAKGCVPAMACASAVTELALGKTVQQARALQPAELVAAVGGLPQASTHAARLALEVLTTALGKLEASGPNPQGN
jgi:nitrogen fixation protein NifU and related proteins